MGQTPPYGLGHSPVSAPCSPAIQRVLVVGAGVAGLQTARQLLKIGLEVMVLEAHNDIAGVWSQNHYGCKLQTPWRQYQFPEFLWPLELQPEDEYPSAEQVRDYVRAYAWHFDLLPHIRLNCKLLRLRWTGSNHSWECLYADTAVEKFFKTRVDYVVVCTGIFSNPFIPSYPGASDFVGQQIHAKHFRDVSVASGRRVLIVGAGKTGTDCACNLLASRAAASVTMLYRQAHWPIPKRVLGLSTRTLFFSRMGAATVPPYYTAGRLRTAVAAATKPLRALFWKGMEVAISSRFHAARATPPSVSLPGDLFYGGQVLDDSLERLAKAGSLEAIRGEVNRFVRNGVILQDGSFHAADLVLYCTGYAKTYDYFDGPMRARLGLQKDGLYLYRNCIPPGVPQLAFVGSEVSTYSNIVTQGLQALWLAHVLAGRVEPPPAAAMEQDVREQQVWKREVMPVQRNRGSVLMTYQTHYHDQLLQDMQLHSRRKGANFLSECFGAYTAADYSPLLSKRDAELVTGLEQAAAACKAAQAAAVAGAAVARAQQQRQRQQQGPRTAAMAVGRSLYPAHLRAPAVAACSAAAREGTPARRLSGDLSNCDADDEESVRSVVAAALAATAAAMESGRHGGYGRSYRRASDTSGDGTCGGAGVGNWTTYPTAGMSFTSEAAFQVAKAGIVNKHTGVDSSDSVTAAAVEAVVAAALAATAAPSLVPTTRRSSDAMAAEQEMHTAWPYASGGDKWQEASSRCEEGASGRGGYVPVGRTVTPHGPSVLDGAAVSAAQQHPPQHSGASAMTEAAADCGSLSDGASSAPATKSQSMSLLRKLLRLRSSLSRSESATSVAGSNTPTTQQPGQTTQQEHSQQGASKLRIRIPSGCTSGDVLEGHGHAGHRSLESALRSGLSSEAAAAAAAAAMGAITLVIGSSASQSARMWEASSSPRAASAAATATGFLSAPSSKRGMSRSVVETRSMRGSVAAVAAAAAAALAAANTVANIQAAGYERGGGGGGGGSGGGSGVASARSSTQGIDTPGGSVHGANSYRSHRLCAQSSELVAAATATAFRRLSRRASVTTTAADEGSGAATEEPQSSLRFFAQLRPAASAAAACQPSQGDEPFVQCSINDCGVLHGTASGAAASASVRRGSHGLEDVHRCSEQLASGSYSLGPGLSVERNASADESAWDGLMAAETAGTPAAEPVPIPGLGHAASDTTCNHFDCSWRQHGASCGGASSSSSLRRAFTADVAASAVPPGGAGTGQQPHSSTAVSPPLPILGGGRGSNLSATTTGFWQGSPSTPPLSRSRSHVPRAAAAGYSSAGAAAGPGPAGIGAFAALPDGETPCSGASIGSAGLLSAFTGDSGTLSSAAGSITLNGGMCRLPPGGPPRQQQQQQQHHHATVPLSPPLPTLHHAHQLHHCSNGPLHHHHQHLQQQQQQVNMQYRQQQQQQHQQQHKHATARLAESLIGLGGASGAGAAGSGASPPPSLLLMLAHRRRHSALDPMPMSMGLETLSEEDVSVTTTATPSFCGGVVVASESRARSTGGVTGCEDDDSPRPLSRQESSGCSLTRGSSDCLKVGVAAVHAARLVEKQGAQSQLAASSAWLHTELSST
ncbi:hypothetical protein CHLRE_06g298550v5 [Chlamydomonas reinhardtii]|nr:uncharacterized protein CHLRE_06g298550v5 [Chlamydomonas reinhardtii]PNW82892.1 hypothetical protein CHLRE_06g298550v5 [Chlamydomonas reinhardtii]